MGGKLPDDLELVDALMSRWARGMHEGPGGGRHPLEVIRLMHDGAVLGGGDEGAWYEIVDSEVTKSPVDVKQIVVAWYCRRGPPEVKARKFGISRTAFYDRWRGALRYMQGALKSKLSALV